MTKSKKKSAKVINFSFIPTFLLPTFLFLPTFLLPIRYSMFFTIKSAKSNHTKYGIFQKIKIKHAKLNLTRKFLPAKMFPIKVNPIAARSPIKKPQHTRGARGPYKYADYLKGEHFRGIKFRGFRVCFFCYKNVSRNFHPANFF